MKGRRLLVKFPKNLVVPDANRLTLFFRVRSGKRNPAGARMGLNLIDTPNLGLVRRTGLQYALLGMYQKWVLLSEAFNGPWLHVYGNNYSWGPESPAGGIVEIGPDIIPTYRVGAPSSLEWIVDEQTAIMGFPPVSFQRTTALLSTPVHGWFMTAEETPPLLTGVYTVLAGGPFDDGPLIIVGKGFLNVAVKIALRNSRVWP